jgi:hypothetical protein
MTNKKWVETHDLYKRFPGEEPRKWDMLRYLVGDVPHDARLVEKRRVGGKMLFVMDDGAKVALHQILGTWYVKQVHSSGGDTFLLPLLLLAAQSVQSRGR